MAGDVDHLLDVAEFLQLVEDVRHHRLARHLHHRLGREVRVRAQARSLACQRNDHFHGALVPSRPYLSLSRTTSSSSGRRDLEDIAVGQGDHLVDCPRRDSERFADLELHVLELLRFLDAVDDLTRQEMDGLVLLVVVLDGKLLAGVDVQDLPDVAVRAGPDRLVPPRLWHFHDLHAACAGFGHRFRRSWGVFLPLAYINIAFGSGHVFCLLRNT